MAVNSSGKSWTYQFVIILSGLAMLTASFLVFLVILKSIYGNLGIAQLIPSEENFRKVFTSKQYEVAVLNSKYTERMLPEGSTWLTDNLNTWKNTLRNSRVKFREISDLDIEKGILSEYKLLILPGTKVLSDREISRIKAFLENGGSVFATGGIASFSNDGKWRGWDFLSEVFGLNFSGEITSSDMTRIHTLRGGLPLTTDIPAGFSLKIATWDRPMSCEVLDPRTTQVSFWYNYRKEMGLASEEINKSAGIAYGHYGKGRFVWMGFELNSVIGQQEDYIYFDKLFKNSLSWLSYKPTVFVKDWPGNYNAAAIIMPSLTTDIYNTDNILPILRQEGVPAAFFMEPHIADEYRDYVKKLSAYGETGSVVDVGYLASANDTVNKLFSYNWQLKSFRQAKYKFKSMPQLRNEGVRPLYGLYNENSVRALISSGFKYIITDSLTDRSVPKIIIRGEDKILAFTKTARDDYEVIRNYGLADTDFQLYTYQEDVDRLVFEGGLYMFNLHSEYQMRPEYAGVLQGLIRYMKSKNIWITTPGELSKWWLDKNQVEISTEVRSPKRTAIEVSNPGKTAVRNIDVYVSLNKDVKKLIVSSDIFGTKIPKYKFDPKRQLVIINMDHIPAGDSYSYYLDYQE